MKIYSWNSQKISINDNGKIKTLSPFFLVDENKAHLFNDNSFTNISDILNVEEMQNISQNIKLVISDFKDEIMEHNNEINAFKENVNNAFNKLSQIENTLNEINIIKAKYEEMLSNINKMYEDIKNIYDKIEVKEKNITENFSNLEKNTAVLSSKTSDILEQAENKMASKYFNMRLSLENIYEKYINEIKKHNTSCQKYSEISKKWASNPLNIPVEENLYSARHYALLRVHEVKNG